MRMDQWQPVRRAEKRLRCLVRELYDQSRYAKDNPNIRLQHHRLVAVDGADIELASDDRSRKYFSVRSNGQTSTDGKAPPPCRDGGGARY